MITRIHHLDCCTLCPLAGRLLFGPTGTLCAHVLLLETRSQGLILVDSGTSTLDRRDRLGRTGLFSVIGGFPTDEEGTAVAAIRRLGLDPADVRHVVLTHFDLDHAGGVADVPDATVHLLAAEQDAARTRAASDRVRYRPAHLDAVRNWRPYEATGEAWHGFPAAQEVEGLEGDVLLLPLTGHTLGHAAVAVRKPDGEGWLVHAGDAYFHRATITGGRPPIGHRLFERAAATDWARVRDNHARLAEVVATEDALEVFCAHDIDELQRLRAR